MAPYLFMECVDKKGAILVGSRLFQIKCFEDYFFMLSMEVWIISLAFSGPAQSSIFTHFPGSRSL